MDLNILWFILIAVLYVGFFFLEGFDFGVGMLRDHPNELLSVLLRHPVIWFDHFVP